MSSAVLHDGSLVVPVIDISSFRMPYADAAARERVVRQVDRAARTVGFMQITGHGIPATALEAFTSATDAFFALDRETKERYRCPSAVGSGYTPPKDDLFESINVGATPPAPRPQEGPPQGPQEGPPQGPQQGPSQGLPQGSPDAYPPDVCPVPEVPGFEAAVTAWFEAAGRVARTMVRIFGAALGGREDCLAGVTDHSADVLRVNNYRLSAGPDGTRPAGRLGMGAHTDRGIVTVLWADRTPGLEIHGADGRWHPVRPAGSALLVNLGDAIARLTNGEWISATHRVAAPRIDGAGVPRRSAAYFHDGNVSGYPAAKLAGSRAWQLSSCVTREAAPLGTV